MLLYAITDRSLYGEPGRARAALLRQAERWFAAGVSFVQLREKDLPPAELACLARDLAWLSQRFPRTRLLVNGPAPLAKFAGAAGVHLTGAAHASLAERIAEARQTWACGEPFLSVACHSTDEAAAARRAGASLIVFAPVFEKPLPSLQGNAVIGPGAASLPGRGLPALAEACQAAAPIPVVALGGITPGNATLCLAAGAAGVAGIRLFAQDDWLRLLEEPALSPAYKGSPKTEEPGDPAG